MDNNQEEQNKVFNMDDAQSNGFKKVTTSSSSKKPSEYIYKKPKVGFGRGFVLPVVSGFLGASLMLGVCLYVPEVKDKVFGNTVNSTPATSINVSKGETTKAIDLSKYSDTSIEVANKVLPSVVGIEVQFSVTSTTPFISNSIDPSESKATGSGVIISKDGYILTNNHIIDTSSSSNSYYMISSANKILVHLYEEDEPVEAEIIGSDEVTDLAILKIEKDDLTPAELGDSDSIKIGEFTMAIGNPLEMPYTVTSGIVSGLNREITSTDGTSYTLIQTDAAINSGNSGGALVNADGKVIGINTLKLAGTGIEGMGFAIPINSTLDITDQLINTGKVKRPYIGIGGINVTEAYSSYYKIPQGVYVSSIEKDGPARESELKVGDIITEINGTKISSMSELNNVKYKLNIGDKIKLKIYRNSDKSTHDVEITLTEQP